MATFDREPGVCAVCMRKPWRVAIAYQERPPSFLCRDCLWRYADGLPEGCLYVVRQTCERRFYFGGVEPLLAWLFQVPSGCEDHPVPALPKGDANGK